MDFTLTGIYTQNTANILRKCGYFANYDPRTGKMSFIRKIGGGRYPRFHVYIKGEQLGDIKLNLHADMKEASYGEETAHSGEYDTDLVKREYARVVNIFNSYLRTAVSEEPKKQKPKKGIIQRMWEKIWGGIF